MTVRDATPHLPAAEDQEDKHRLTALEGLAALSLDALSSVAYGPEAIVIVLAAAGTVGLGYTVPITIASDVTRRFQSSAGAAVNPTAASSATSIAVIAEGKKMLIQPRRPIISAM